MTSIEKFDDWINDERFITSKQKNTYLETGLAPKGNPKKSIEKRFLEHYTHFKFLRKLKDSQVEFELGDLREIPLNFDLRADSVNHDIALLIAYYVHNYHSNASKINEMGGRIYTSLQLMKEINLLPTTFSSVLSEEVFKLTDDQIFAHNIIKQVSLDTFRQANNYLKFKKVYVKVKKEIIKDEINEVEKDVYTSELFSDIETSKLQEFEQNLKNQGITRKFGSELVWDQKVSKFLKTTLKINIMYTAWDISDCAIEYVSDDFVKQKDSIKKNFYNKIMKSVVTKEFNKAVKIEVQRKLNNLSSLIDYKSNLIDDLVIERKLLDNFIKNSKRFSVDIKNNELISNFKENKWTKFEEVVDNKVKKNEIEMDEELAELFELGVINR